MDNLKKPTTQTQLEGNITFYKGLAWLLVALGFLAGVWGCWQVYYDTDKEMSFLAKLGNLGSFFQGTVSSLWALAGLMFIYVAFLAQRLQMVKQDEELEAQQRQFELQQRSILIQQFENGFFQLLNLQNDIANRTHQTTNYSRFVTTEQPPVVRHEEGKHLFKKWYEELYNKIESSDDHIKFVKLLYPDHVGEITVDMKREVVRKQYDVFYKQYQDNLGHYFRNLYHLFKFVDTCEVLNSQDVKRTIRNKRRYTSIARAQLSQFELALLFYNGITDNGEDKFKPLIERYGLLENLNTDDLPDKVHMNFYKDSAFSDLED